MNESCSNIGGERSPRPVLVACLALVVFVLLVYWQIRDYEFIVFDDDKYVTDNRHVKSGITWEGVKWAFSLKHKHDKMHWHPLTWLSHMLDCDLYGLNAGMHHNGNMILHALNSFLLFLGLYYMTGGFWKSFFVASIFAVHPINVDSVAWISARKNILSTFFWMLGILIYTRYTKQPGIYNYILFFVIFIAGLMAKTMLVTLPFVLLLFDFWPLKRIDLKSIGLKSYETGGGSDTSGITGVTVFHAVVEKIPMFVISVFFVLLNSSVMKQYGTIVSTETISMTLRFENAVVSYICYLWKLFWPANLAVYYPYPDSIPLWHSGGAFGLLIGMTFIMVSLYKKMPYLPAGWFLYLGTMFPVIGFMQIGLWPAMADRWAYIPFIGIYVIIAWGGEEILRKLNFSKTAVVTFSSAVIILLGTAAWWQAGFWKDSVTLFEHSLAVAEDNCQSRTNLGMGFVNKQKMADAEAQFKEAIRLCPDFDYAHNNLGNLLSRRGDIEGAVKHFSEAIRLNPGYKEAYNNLAVALVRLGRSDDAINHYRTALIIDPEYKEAHNNLALEYLKSGRASDAVKHFLEAVRIDPRFAEAYNNLGSVMQQSGDLRKAVELYKKALIINPDLQVVQKNLDRAIAAQAEKEKTISNLLKQLKENPGDHMLCLKAGNFYKEKMELGRALTYYKKALIIKPDFIEAKNGRAIVYAMQGEYEKALVLLKEVISIQPDEPKTYFYIAGIYSRQNKKKDAIEWLDKAIKKGYSRWDNIKTDKNLDNIRETQYYQKIIKDR